MMYQAYAEYRVPRTHYFEFDTMRMVERPHVLRIVSICHIGKEDVRKIPFAVHKRPHTAVEGMPENAVADGILPIMIMHTARVIKRNL